MTDKPLAAIRATTALGLVFSAPLAASAETTGWDLVNAIEVDEVMTDTSYEVRKVFPSGLQAPLADYQLTGYVVPLWSDGDVTEFMLISDIGFCPFCGDPAHGAAVQVSVTGPVPDLEEGSKITVIGNLEPVLDPYTTQSVILKNAQIVG